MDNEDNEVYEDAYEDQSEIPEAVDVPCLEDSVKDTVYALDLFLKNKFNEALDLMTPFANKSMYHALGQGTVLFMQAVLTLTPNDIETALQALNEAVEVCNRKRKKGAILYITKMIGQVDYNSYTEEEVHAELCYAECLLLTAILTFLADQNFTNFIKGGLKVRVCYQSYKECAHILDNRNWKNSKQRQHYASGVKMGIGTFNLMISQLPTRILRLLEFIGFSGNKLIGLKELKESYEETNGLRSPLAVLILVSYHTVIAYIFGTGDGDIKHSETMLEEMLTKYPEGALFLFFYGRVKQIQGKFNEAIRIFQQSINSQEQWNQFHYLCYWEMMWCYCAKCDWVEAAKCTDILRKECRWSPAIYTYVHAAILYMIAEEQRIEATEEIIELMRTVPSLKQKVAGKSYPSEKYVVGKSQKFCFQDYRLLLPMMELLYVWNNFPMIGKSHHCLEKITSIVQKALSQMESKKETLEGNLPDDYCLLLLLNGACLKAAGKHKQAEEYFKNALNMDKKVQYDTHLVAFAAMELGILAMEQGHYKKAKEILEQAIHNYHGYSVETIIHFRVHSALRQIKSISNSVSMPDISSEQLNGMEISSKFSYSNSKLHCGNYPVFQNGLHQDDNGLIKTEV